jgi:hypothetical protein
MITGGGGGNKANEETQTPGSNAPKPGRRKPYRLLIGTRPAGTLLPSSFGFSFRPLYRTLAM